MNKKILLGSIIAICILIGVSFTSVVGYRSVTSDVKASPLFNIRSSRAIDEENEDLSSEYVGKGEEINLLIPNRDNDSEIIQTIIGNIRIMDDETFNRFINFVIYNFKQSNEFKNLNINEIMTAIHFLRKNQENNINNIWRKNYDITSWENQFCYLLGVLIELILDRYFCYLIQHIYVYRLFHY